MTQDEIRKLIIELRKFRSIHSQIIRDKKDRPIRDLDNLVSYMEDVLNGAPYDNYGVVQL